MPVSYYMVLTVLYLWVFILGACIGSFLNVIIYRVPSHISIAAGRSFCPNCHHMIRAKDNIPVVSWLILRGRCRDCGQAISRRYPTVEILTGIVFILVFFRFGFSLYSLLLCMVISILISIAYIDHDTMTIPNGLVIALLVMVVAIIAAANYISVFDRLIGALCISIPMLLITLIIPGAFGGGDMKLMVVSGIMLGWQGILLAFFIAIFFAGFRAIYLLVSGKIKSGAHVPFGPYLSFGIGVVLLYGNMIIRWYIGLF